jgi:hypothetical protein
MAINLKTHIKLKVTFALFHKNIVTLKEHTLSKICYLRLHDAQLSFRTHCGIEWI